VLDALEADEYWTACREIQEAEKVDVFHFADALAKFGLCDLAFIDQQAKRRLELLDYLDRFSPAAKGVPSPRGEGRREGKGSVAGSRGTILNRRTDWKPGR